MTCRRAINHTPQHVPEAAPVTDPVVVGGNALGDAIAAATIERPMRDLARALTPVRRRVRALHGAQIAKPTGEITRNEGRSFR